MNLINSLHSRRNTFLRPRRISVNLSTPEGSLAFLVTLALLLTFFMIQTAHAFTTGGEHPCTYDFELQTSTMRISCPGSPSTVNVYAETANLQAQKMPDNSNIHLGTPGQQPSSGGSHRPRPKQNTYAHAHSSGTGDPFSTYVWNSNKQLDEARRSLTGYRSSLENISVKLSEGKFNLDTDMNKIMRDTGTADELKSHIVGAMTNQFNFMRSLIMNRNQDFQNIVDLLNILVDVTSEGMETALSTHRMTLDRMDYMNNTLVSVRSMLTSELRKKDKRRRRAGKQGKKTKPKG